MKRRSFIKSVSKASGGLLLTTLPTYSLTSRNKDNVTVGDIMDAFIKQIPGAPFKETVDTLKSGSRDSVVTGVVTTMFATVDVIRKTMKAGANFIIAHEPTFYNHLDATDWLQNDDVYKYKAALLKDNNITVWRNHDYVHSLQADGVYFGVLDELQWRQYNNSDKTIHLPPTSLKDIIAHCKQKLGIEQVRYIGDLNNKCSKVLLMPGAAGGKSQIQSINKTQPDVLICGEISEWETAEYVRDARAENKNLSLVVLGHVASEEQGSIFMVNWMKQNFPGITSTHIPCGNSLKFT